MKRFTMMVDEHFEEWLLFVLLTAAVFAIALQVFMRFVLGSSLTWSEELARYCFIWLIYIAVPYGVKKHRHITLDILYDVVSDRLKKWLNVFATCCVAILAMLIIYYGGIVVSMIHSFGQMSSALKLNMVYVYAAAPVGMILTLIRSIQNMVVIIRNWQKPLPDSDAS